MNLFNLQSKTLNPIFSLFPLALMIAGCSTSKPIENLQSNDAAVSQSSNPLTLEESQLIENYRTRYGAHYAKRMTLFLSEQKSVKRGGVVLVGDSITEGLPIEEAFPDSVVYNRGISGDTILGVLSRVDESIAPLKPKKIYLLISTNDLNAPKPRPVDELEADYLKLLQALRRVAPDAKITVQSVMPTRDKYDKSNPLIREFNPRIKKLSERENLDYIDLTTALSDSEGRLRPDFTGDGIHLNMAGNLEWLKTLLPPDEYVDAALALSRKWSEAHSPIRAITVIDPVNRNEYPGNRGVDELILYTPKSGRQLTGTNEWGNEAIVRNDRIVRKTIGNSPIPSNGYVISGHGKAGDWVALNAKIGASVVVEDNQVKIIPPDPGPLSPKQQIARMRSDILLAAAEAGGNRAPRSFKKEARKLFKDIMELESKPEPYPTERMINLEQQIKSLKSDAK